MAICFAPLSASFSGMSFLNRQPQVRSSSCFRVRFLRKLRTFYLNQKKKKNQFLRPILFLIFQRKSNCNFVCCFLHFRLSESLDCVYIISAGAGCQLKAREMWWSSNSRAESAKLTTQSPRKNIQLRTNRNFAIRAEYRYSISVQWWVDVQDHFCFYIIYQRWLIRSSICSSDDSRGGGADFLAGFVLGGAVFGTLAYVFAPQVVPY